MRSSKTTKGDSVKTYVDNAEVRLFASVDLAGSTMYKGKTRDWADTFSQFFKDFPKVLDDAYSRLRHQDILRSAPFSTQSLLSPAKLVGDEIIFNVNIDRHENVLFHSYAVRNAIKAYNASLRNGDLTRGMGLKGTIWLAGFPVLNDYIQLLVGSSTVTDFIGPQIDCGFRLSKLATSRRIVLSIEVALMVAKAATDHGFADQNYRLFYDGRHDLRGINGGLPYPIVWLDVRDDDSPEEQLVGGMRPRLSYEKLRNFLRDYIKDNELQQMFLRTDSDYWFSPFEPNGKGASRYKPFVVELAARYHNRMPKAEKVQQSAGQAD